MFALLTAAFDLRSRWWNVSCAVLLLWAGMVQGASAAAAAPSDATPSDQSQATAASEASGALQEVVVTATRRAEDIQKVPISITAISQDQMDITGQRDIADLQKYTPGLNVAPGQGGVNQISIRGISSGAGAATTGIYIDDTPIMGRNFGYNAGSAFPSLFDLQRVEVLRGPQGTLFGAGSEGGTVRAILPQPNLSTYTEYARAEGVSIGHGGNGGEAGFEVSGPIVSDRLAFLASVFYRRDPGYINAVTQGAPFTILDPTGLAGGNAITYPSLSLYQRNANWDEIKGYRLALKFVPFDGLEITPALIYQNRWFNDATTNFYLAASNLSSGQFNNVVYPAGNPATNPRLSPQPSFVPALEQAGEHWLLPTLSVQWSLGPVQLIYNGSYFKRDQYTWRDDTLLYEFLYTDSLSPQPGDQAAGPLPNYQANLVQEVRLQSADANGRFTWVIGAFYSRQNQSTNDVIGENFTANLSPFAFTFGAPPDCSFGCGFTNGPPFGPGSTGIQNYFGYPLLGAANVSFTGVYHSRETQLALFGEDNFKITDQLTLTTGLRLSDFLFKLNAGYGGAENSIFPTFGLTCADLGNCVNGVPPPAQFPTSNVSVRNTAVTPRISLQEQFTPNNMVYATVSKGFRPAGADLQVPVASCGKNLAQDGYLTQPANYDSDYVWNYEIGTKNRIGPLVIDGSVYFIHWSNIQTFLYLPACAYGITINAGHVNSQGMDLALQYQAFQTASSNLLLSGAWGFNNAKFSEDSVTPSGKVLYHEGTGVPGSGAPITLSFIADYNFRVTQSVGAYLHYDWSHFSSERRAGQTDPSNPNFNPLVLTTGAYSQTNLRLGSRFLGESLDVSLFVNNLTDSRPLIGAQNAQSNPVVWTASTLQPRTYGLTVVWKH